MGKGSACFVHGHPDCCMIVDTIGGKSVEYPTCAKRTYLEAGQLQTGQCHKFDTESDLLSEQPRRAIPRDPAQSCSVTILTTFITGMVDWQRNVSQPATFQYMKAFYESVRHMVGVHVVVLHDQLPQNVTEKNYWSKSGSLIFVRVDVGSYPKELGVNDVRFFLFRDQVEAQPDWSTVFSVDITDVMVNKNPCELVAAEPDKLYINDQPGVLAPNRWMEKRFLSMGGNYLDWYRAGTYGQRMTLLNAGVIGGSREQYLKFLDVMCEALIDPSLAARIAGEQVNVDMAALNWVAHNKLALAKVIFGFPLQSIHNRYEEIKDHIYFLHKGYPTLR